MLRKTLATTLFVSLCIHGSAPDALAQEPSNREAETSLAATNAILDAPRFAEHGSLETLERKGRWMTSWGAASLGVGAGLIAGFGGWSVACARNPGCDYVGGAGMLLTGSILLTAGAILTPMGVKRKRWARKGRERELQVSVSPTGVLLSGSF